MELLDCSLISNSLFSSAGVMRDIFCWVRLSCGAALDTVELFMGLLVEKLSLLETEERTEGLSYSLFEGSSCSSILDLDDSFYFSSIKEASFSSFIESIIDSFTSTFGFSST